MPLNRRALLAGRWAARDGHVRRQESESQSFLDAAPENLLAIYYMSFAYWANEESGKAIDLLNRASNAPATSVRVPAFAGALYVQRRLYDKAQADYLQEMQATGAARVAERDLADLYGQRGCRIIDAANWRKPRASGRTARSPCASRVAARSGSATRHAGPYAGAGTRSEPGAVKTWNGCTIALSTSRASKTRTAGCAPSSSSSRLRRSIWSTRRILRREGGRRGGVAASGCRAPQPGVAAAARAAGRSVLGAGTQGGRPGRVEAGARAQSEQLGAGAADRVSGTDPPGIHRRYVPGADAIDEALTRKIKPHPGAQAVERLDDEVTEVNADGGPGGGTLVAEALTEQGRDALITQSVPTVGTVKICRPTPCRRAVSARRLHASRAAPCVSATWR